MTMTKSATPKTRPREVALWIHRYVGLAISVFLLLAGVTGSLLAFYTELDAALHPELFHVAPPTPGAHMLDPFELQERMKEQVANAEGVHGVILRRSPGESVNYWVDEHEVFVDPYTGKVLGKRKWSDLSEGMINLMPFIYRFHFSLGLEEVGTVLFGIVALLWTLDCFVGAYLTFPRASRAGAVAREASWLARWWPSWLVKTGRFATLLFTWHRASGLWLWGLFLAIAWSAVALNLGEQVYLPVMSAMFGKQEHAHELLPALPSPLEHPAIAPRAARALGSKHMAAKADALGFRVLSEAGLDYDPEHGVYVYSVESTLDPSQRFSETSVYFDGNDGRLLDFSALTGQHTGSSITSWIIALHFGAVRAGGFAYRALVCLTGLGVALLSVTGVWIWWRKRRPRAAAK